MLIESIGAAAHRSRTDTILYETQLTAMNAMKHLFLITLIALLTAACSNNPLPETDPEGTIYYTETDELFPNPERGFHSQIYYTSADLNKHAIATGINQNRTSAYNITLYLHSYYLTDYMESDIPQEFLDRLDQNMQALREGGAKAVVRFSYKDNFKSTSKPWDASQEWISRHIDQVGPYLMKNADVIFCIQCGFIGSWGEWYYTTAFKFNPSKDEDFEPRWQMVEHLMNVTPKDRQIGFRTPGYKMRYLKMRGDTTMAPLTAAEAYQPTIKARWAGHNDCFVSSQNDVGTYFSTAERIFWQEDTKYTVMGGETCEKVNMYSNGENAIKNMQMYHWTYINRDYHREVINSWIADQHMDEIKRRLGYRLALDKAYLTQEPQAGQKFDAKITLHNSGFAAPVNKRDVELVFVSTTDNTDKYVYPQTEDPRFWMAGDTVSFTLSCTLDNSMAGDYKVYLNLPDPYESLHNDPRFSIRLANDAIWEEETGMNRLATINVK